MSVPNLRYLMYQPMVWVGIYIAVASILCTIVMALDLLHGFRNKRLWFPSRHFTLNAASIAAITVAMKLPLDLGTEIGSKTEELAKLGSLAFMCTMMANLMPSLAAMDNKTLLLNIIGLSILVITVIVNIFMFLYSGNSWNFTVFRVSKFVFNFDMLAYIYTTMMLLLLVIMIASSLAIPTFKEILEVKYQTKNKTFSSDQHAQYTQMSRTETLRRHVRRYWIMAETGNPQFVLASNPLSTASGVICATIVIMNFFVVGFSNVFQFHGLFTYEGYGGSIYLIFNIQKIGVLVGVIAPIFRCFPLLSFKLVSNLTHLTVFNVENYWTQKLYEWKQGPIHFLPSGRSRTLVYNSKSLIVSLCIRLQHVIVILGKVISLIPTVISICGVYCWNSRKVRPFTRTVVSRTDNTDGNLSSYIITVHDEVELGEKTIKRISNSVSSFILKAEKKQNKDLLKLLEKSTGFKGVETFDIDQVQTLLAVELVNSWSLPIVTLTCIAVDLPNVPKDAIKSLLRSVGEGLLYTHQVEESLCCEKEYVNIRKATIILWNEVEHNCMWLDKALGKGGFRGKTATDILKWFSNRAKEIVTKLNGEMVDNPPKELIAANSMYRIAETILLRDESNTEPITKKKLFALLSGMIADILCACFTNLPRVIIVKCQESVIEKREASVKVAAKLLGKTTKIIERLQTCDLQRIDPDKMSYIEGWRLCLKRSIP
ncbi:hypothetical protein Hanom_Chr10g00936931 [Helianthus anomalus]